MRAAVLPFLLFVALAHAGTYKDLFNEQYAKIKNASNGYFSKQGVPYHCKETLIVEDPDYGHETTSEALSYYVWLEAIYGALNGDYSGFNTAWNTLEETLIPKLQPSMGKYDPNVPVYGWGKDPIGQELIDTYGSRDLYMMHWLADVDNRYGFGNTNGYCELGPNEEGSSLILKGSGTVFENIVNPCCDNFTFGGTNGFAWNKDYRQWSYSLAPDADARAIEAAFWASKYATAQGKVSEISQSLSKAAKLGDYLRYSLFDSQFKKVGYCTTANNCPNGVGKESAHYLLSTYVSWGGTLDPQGSTWLGGSSFARIGYQNPIAAYALANDPNLKPKSPSAVEDWQKSVVQQVGLYEYCQSAEGAMVGGVTNSWNYDYSTPPAEVAAYPYNGLYYSEDGSSNWYGFDAWGTARLAEYYYVTGDETAKRVMDKWAAWIISNIKFEDGGYFSVPWTYTISGVAPNVHVKVESTGQSISLIETTARALIYYAAKSGNAQAKSVAKELLDRSNQYLKDDFGISFTEYKSNYNLFDTKVQIPQSGWTGTYPDGTKIDTSSTFLSIRPWYKTDPDFAKVEAFMNGGSMPGFNYHRFFDEVDYALALGAYSLLFEE